jgi:uroporphyrinogen-III decarboxylase
VDSFVAPHGVRRIRTASHSDAPQCLASKTPLKSTYGSKLTFWGSITTQRDLPFGTPADVIRETRRVRDLMSKGGGYILSPSQGIQGDVPAANILALIEPAKEMR